MLERERGGKGRGERGREGGGGEGGDDRENEIMRDSYGETRGEGWRVEERGMKKVSLIKKLKITREIELKK